MWQPCHLTATQTSLFNPPCTGIGIFAKQPQPMALRPKSIEKWRKSSADDKRCGEKVAPGAPYLLHMQHNSGGKRGRLLTILKEHEEFLWRD